MNAESCIFLVSLVLYVAAFMLYCVHLSLNRPKFYIRARAVAWVGAALAVIGLILRWHTVGHPPLSNMYESLVTLSVFITLAGLFITRKNSLSLLEAGACAASVLMYGLASVFSSEGKPLIPALQSYWLHLHVSMAFIGESLFAIAFILSYLLCLKKAIMNSDENREFESAKEKALCCCIAFGLPAIFSVGMAILAIHLRGLSDYGTRWHGAAWGAAIGAAIAALPILAFMNRKKAGVISRKWLPDCETLDNLIYRAIALGYPIFTVGALVFGMVWANKAWGRYWGWDPKETWALITFLVYSVYLHVRLVRGCSGTYSAGLSVIGFLATMFTLFGVNFIVSGLHSYI